MPKILLPLVGAAVGLAAVGPMGVVGVMATAKLAAITGLGGGIAAVGIATQERQDAAVKKEEDDVTDVATEDDDDTASIASSNVDAIGDDDLANLIARSISEEMVTSHEVLQGQNEGHSLSSLEFEENLVNECVEKRANRSSADDVTNIVLSSECQETETEHRSSLPVVCKADNVNDETVVDDVTMRSESENVNLCELLLETEILVNESEHPANDIITQELVSSNTAQVDAKSGFETQLTTGELFLDEELERKDASLQTENNDSSDDINTLVLINQYSHFFSLHEDLDSC